jgi:hypothetical protein
MINSTIKIKCKHCGEETTIKVNSIDRLQEEIVKLRKELNDRYESSSPDLEYLKGMFFGGK